MSNSVCLYAPSGYWNLTPEEKEKICNGAGTKGMGGYLVPDTMYGLSITEAANIHDYMYYVGMTLEDKREADRVFLNNMIRIIEANSKFWVLEFLRKRRAKKYYLAVDWFGGPAFWSGKNDINEGEVVI